MSIPHREPPKPNVPIGDQSTQIAPVGQPAYRQPGQPPPYGAAPLSYGGPYPRYGASPPPYGAPQPPMASSARTLERPGNVKTAAVLAFTYATLRIISCLFLLVSTFGLWGTGFPARDLANQYIDVFLGLVFSGLMIWGAAAAWTNRSTKILLFTSWALLAVSIILVLAAVSPSRVSSPELVCAAVAVLALILSITIIVLLSTAYDQRPVRHVGLGWSIAGAIAIIFAVVLMAARTEIVGPSVGMFAAFQLLVLGLLMILIRAWGGATLTLLIVGALFGVVNIALALYGSFALGVCGYDGTSAYTVWTSQTQWPTYIGAHELRKWAIVGSVGVAFMLGAAFALPLFIRHRRLRRASQ